MPYATTMHFGAKKGEFGSYVSQRATGRRRLRGGFAISAGVATGNARRVPIPWGDIPARPFLGFDDNDGDRIVNRLKEYLNDKWQGRN